MSKRWTFVCGLLLITLGAVGLLADQHENNPNINWNVVGKLFNGDRLQELEGSGDPWNNIPGFDQRSWSFWHRDSPDKKDTMSLSVIDYSVYGPWYNYSSVSISFNDMKVVTDDDMWAWLRQRLDSAYPAMQAAYPQDSIDFEVITGGGVVLDKDVEIWITEDEGNANSRRLSLSIHVWNDRIDSVPTPTQPLLDYASYMAFQYLQDFEGFPAP